VAREEARARRGHEEREQEAYEYEDGDNPEGRQNWFMFQREYPFNSVPENARRMAWESRPRPKGDIGLEDVGGWTPIGPVSTQPSFPNFGVNSGRINAIAVSPADSNLVLIGASTGGIWRSTDGGVNFTPVSDSQVDLAVGSIAFSKSNPSIVYAGMGDMQGCCDYLGSGVLKSTDGGQTWTHVNNSTLPEPAAIGRIEVDPNDPNRLYVALYRSLNKSSDNNFPYGGVYLSTDGGVNWSNRLAGLPRDLAVDPTASSGAQRTLYAAMRGLGTSGDGGVGGVYKSTDGGQTWRSIYSSGYAPAFSGSSGLRDIRVALSLANPQKIYIYSGRVGSSPEIRLSVSNNGEAPFTDTVLTTVDKGQLGYNTYLAVDPTNANTVYIGTRDVYKSTNGGSTWTNLTKANLNSNTTYDQALAHPDQHAIAFASSGTIYIGNDGGIYRTTNGGTSFQSLNQTLSLTQFTSLARHPTDPNISYGGTQDNGTQRRLGGGFQWQDFASGDGGQTVVNPINPSTVYTTVYYGRVRAWANNGDAYIGGTNNTTFGEDASDAIARIAFYPPFVGNGVNSTLYFGTWRLFVNSNPDGNFLNGWSAPGGTADWTRADGLDVLSAIGVSRSNPNVIYTGSAEGWAMVSTNGGQTATPIMNGLPNRFITSITVDPANSALAYLTVSGYGSGHIFKTTNTGASWTDVSGNLPNIPVNTLLIDKNNASVLYAGTDIGVFRSTTGGGSWQTLNNGLPPVVVTAFTTNTSGQIQLATYGRGAYEATNISVPCSYSITPTDQSFTNAGGSGNVNIIAGSGCAWTISNNAPWVAVFSLGQDGPGNGQIKFSVAANNTNSARTGTITIAGQTFTISQAAGNVIDDSPYFVTQQYQDFLNRPPDADGLGYWTNEITMCGSNAQCIHDRRVAVSDAFFFEAEYQQTGGYIYRLYKAGLGQRPSFAQFSSDRGLVVAGPNLDQTKTSYAQTFVQRSAFLSLYPRTQNADQFLDALFGSILLNSGVDLSSQKGALKPLYDGTDNGRAAILRQIADGSAFTDAEYNRSFVLMEYFGYLRRDPDQGGFDFWLGQVNKFPLRNVDIQHAMACSFITSAEYQTRFSSVVTHTNRECPQ
jgi:photosystem II stability/assembly factor-like uncharacterized protein